MLDSATIKLRGLLQGSILSVLLPLATLLLLLASNYYIFLVVPDEQVMGAVQRIFYFHVGAAMTVYFLIGFLLVGSVCFLSTRKVVWDFLGEASGVLAFLFCTIVLTTGMIWGHSAWNTWWRWEPRLVSFLVLWLILFSYQLLRSTSEKGMRQRNFASVLGILSAVNVPIVIFSIKLLSHSEQLHPEVVSQGGLQDTRFVYALLLASISLIMLSLWLLKLKLVQLIEEEQIDLLELHME